MSKHFAPAEFDTHPPELYGSAAQRHGHLPVTTESIVGSPETSTAVYTPLRAEDVREGSNEYDYIPAESSHNPATKSNHTPAAPRVKRNTYTGPASGEVVSGGGVGSSFRGREKKVTRNSLYEDHELEEELAHPSLQCSHKGGVSRGGDTRHWRHCCSNILVAFFIAVAICLGAASLCISIMVWFGANDDMPSTTEPTTQAEPVSTTVAPTVMVDCGDCKDNITLVQQALASMKTEIEGMRQDLQTVKSNLSQVVYTLMNETDELNSTLELPSPSLPTIIVLPNVSSGFSLCESRLSDSCDLSVDVNNCTAEYTPQGFQDMVVVSAVCVFRIIERDSDALVATMELDDEGTVRCTCRRVAGTRSNPGTVECQLQLTHCRLP